MPIKNLMVYEPKISKLEKEEDIISLLDDVRVELSMIDPGSKIGITPLTEIVKIVEKGQYIHKLSLETFEVDNRVDLREAANFVSQYKYYSEGKCHSCHNYKTFKPCQDETFAYCGLKETEDNVNTKKGYSPRVEEYSSTGCSDIKPFFRKIEEVLKDQ